MPKKVARGAGSIFKINEKIIRPAQDCTESYGKGLVFQEIRIKQGKLVLEELKRIYSESFKYGLGMHTYNTYEKLAVIDVLGYKYIILGRIYNIIKIFVKSIFKFSK